MTGKFQNRIREIREARGLTLQQVADLIAEQTGEVTTRTQLSRLELGARKLTVAWMRKLATALQVDPTDLIHRASLASAQDEVEPLAAEQIAPLVRALKARGLHAYTLVKSAVPNRGYQPGDMLTVDAATTPQDGDIVLVKVGEHLVVRQFVAPRLVVTNKPGPNTALSLDDSSVPVAIVGVVIADD